MNIENENDHLILISRYLSGEATPEQAMALQEWLNVPENKLEYDRIVSIWGQLPGSVSLSDVNIMQEWRELEKAVETKTKRQKTISMYRYMAAASIILIFITIGFFWFNGQKKADNNFQDQDPQFTIAAKNEIINQKLPDSSVLTINRNSNISYASSFNTSNREVKLTGEAFFDIAHNESKSFIISIGDLKIKVVGTSFNVKEYQDKQQVEVQVQTGIVKMYTSKKELLVQKGQTGVYEISKGELVLKNGININSISYATRSFSFDDLPFAEAIVYLEDAFSVDIQYDSTGFKDCRLFAEFSNASLSSILDALCATLNSSYTQKENIYYIKGQGCQ